MNVNDSNRIKHYTEAERLLSAADEVSRKLDAALPGSPERERLENRLSGLSQRALARAYLAGIVLPERITDEAGA